MSEDEDILLAATAAAAAATIAVAHTTGRKRRKRRKRSLWMRPLFQRRYQRGAYNMLMSELRHVEGEAMYSSFTRLSPEEFDYLLSLVHNDITAQSRYRYPYQPIFDLL